MLGYPLTWRRHHEPTEASVADLGATVSSDLAVTGLFWRDQPGVRQEVAHRGETFDGVNLIEQYQREELAHARNRLQQEAGLGIVQLGLPQQVGLQSFQELIVMADHL